MFQATEEIRLHAVSANWLPYPWLFLFYADFIGENEFEVWRGIPCKKGAGFPSEVVVIDFPDLRPKEVQEAVFPEDFQGFWMDSRFIKPL